MILNSIKDITWPSVICLTLIFRNLSLNGCSSSSVATLDVPRGVFIRSIWPGFGDTGLRLSRSSVKPNVAIISAK